MAVTPPLIQWSGGSKGPMAERKLREEGNLGELPALSTSCPFFSQRKQRY